MNGMRSGKLVAVLIVLAALIAPVMAQGTGGNVTVGRGAVDFLTSMKGTLTEIGPILSAIMFVIAGIIYAFGQLQPAESRGRYQAWAMGLIVGGFVVGALSLGADLLAEIAGTFLKS